MTHTPATTPLTDAQLALLMTDLHPSRVSAKQGMSYVEAYDIKATLIRVFGFGGFSADVIDSKIIKAVEVAQVSNKEKMNWAVTAQATVTLRIHQTGATYTETAIAGSKQPDFTESADMAIKSAESDALKRAAIYLGTQFGLSLYNEGATKEIVSTIVAPGQEFRRGSRINPATGQPVGAAPQQQQSAAGSVAHLRPEGVSEEEHAKNMANINAALSAASAKPRDQRAAEYSHRGGPDVPAVLDPTIDDGQREEAMAAADGQH